MKNKLFLGAMMITVLLSLGHFHNSYAQAKPGQADYHLLVACTGAPAQGTSYQECTFTDLVTLINRIINLLFYLSVILATISFIYCGFLFLTAGGDTGKAKKAKEILYKVVIGFLWIFGAWLIVHFITGAFGLLPGASLIENQ